MRSELNFRQTRSAMSFQPCEGISDGALAMPPAIGFPLGKKRSGFAVRRARLHAEAQRHAENEHDEAEEQGPDRLSTRGGAFRILRR